MKRKGKTAKITVDTRGCTLREGTAIDVTFYLHPLWPRVRKLHGVLWLERVEKIVPIGIEPFDAPTNIRSEQDYIEQSEFWKRQPGMLHILVRPIEEPRGMEVTVRLHLSDGTVEIQGRAFRPCGCDRGHGDREVFFEIFSEQPIAAG